MKPQLKNLRTALIVVAVLNIGAIVSVIILFKLIFAVNENLNRHIENAWEDTMTFKNVVYDLEVSGVLESSRFTHNEEDCRYFIEERCDDNMSREECEHELPVECVRFIELAE